MWLTLGKKHVALADGCYRRHHDQVLKAIAESLATAISTSKYHHAPKKAVFFIKPGEKPLACPQCSTGLLRTASDWQLQADLGKQLRFPLHIATTSLRPDMIITSEASRHLIILELTVPWEVLSGLGVMGVAKKMVIIQSASEVADKATRWLWIKRADLWTATVRTWSLGCTGQGVWCWSILFIFLSPVTLSIEIYHLQLVDAARDLTKTNEITFLLFYTHCTGYPALV